MRSWALLGFAVLVACGGNEPGGQDAAADAQKDAKSDTSPGFPVDGGADAFVVTVACPGSAPAEGTSCSQLGEKCEYGDNFYPSCDTVYQCDAQSQKWMIVQQPQSSCTGTAGTCPATLADAKGACSPGGLQCQYSDGFCDCEGCSGPPGPINPTWACVAASSSCPYPRPRLGTSCTQEGAQCDYEVCCAGANMTCSNGVWQGQTLDGPCP